ncbi:MAG: hypothetical protein GY827_04470 [Cytophagales bacterium]|nr:hypothetical protein [Cytophagales bacterium]
MKNLTNSIAVTLCLLFSVICYSQNVFYSSRVDTKIWNNYTQLYETDVNNADVDITFYWEGNKTKSMVLFMNDKFHSAEKIKSNEITDIEGDACFLYIGNKSKVVYHIDSGIILIFSDYSVELERYLTVVIMKGDTYSLKIKKYKKALNRYKGILELYDIKI